MNKNKKLISLICALAMIVSMFSSMIVVNAATNDDITQGITLTLGKVDEDNKTAEIIVGFKGITDGFKSGKIAFSVPSTVTSVVKNDDAPGTGILNVEGTEVGYSVSMGASKLDGPDGEIVKFTLTFSSDLDKDVDVVLGDASNMYDTKGVYYGITDLLDGDVQIQPVTVTLPKSSNAPTPKPVTNVTPAPVATEPPSDDSAPTLAPIVTVETGLTLTLGTVDKENKTVEVIAGFKGITDGFKSGKIAFSVPSTVTSVVKNDDAPGTGILNVEGTEVGYSVSMGASKLDGPDGEIVKFTLTYSVAPTADEQITLTDASNMYDAKGIYYGITDLLEGDVQIVAPNLTIPGFGAEGDAPEAPTVEGKIDLADKVDKEVTDTPAEGVSQYYIVADVKKGDAPATYGTDYAVKYGETELTPAQYSNLINGYFEADNVKDLNVSSMKDVIDNLSFVIYDNSVTVATKLVNRATQEVEDESEASGVGTVTPTKAPAGPSMTVTADKSVEVGKFTIITAEMKNLKADQVGGTYAYTVDATYLKELGAPTTTDGVYSITLGAVKVAAKVPVTITYKVGEEVIAEETVNIKITKESTNDGGSSSSGTSTGNGSGPIANGSAGSVGTGTGATGAVKFNDLDSVPWAKQAITLMAAKGIINGRDANTFDPNANITRAEYCQILIGAIGKTNEAADSNFDDVATNAWYYHAVSVASKYGIVSGYGDGNFGPNNLITRQDMALMTLKAAQVMNKNLAATTSKTFADADQISGYAYDAVMTLANAGIINGMSDTEFAPKANATRAQAAKILYDTFVK